MQVTVESTGTLERRMRVELPAERIEQEVASRLKSVGRTAKLKGFRPGKVPPKVVKQRYGKQIRQEVLSELMQKSYTDAVMQENLNPAGGPRIETEDSKDDKNFAYVATFEIMPQVELKDLDKIEVEVPEVEIGDKDMDEMILRLRRQKATWNEVDRKSAEGDRVICDFTGTLKGEEFEGGKGTDVPVTLGLGQMLPDFEKGLTGVAAGDEKSIKVKFPKNYHAEDLAGQKTEFAIKVHRVEEETLPPVDDELAAMFEVTEGGIEQFMNDVRDNMEREAEEKAKGDVREQLMEGLLDKNPIEVPQTLKHQEAHSMQHEAMQRLGIEDHDQAPPIANFEEMAERRVRLSLLVSQLISDEKITVDDAKVREHVEKLCASYDNSEDMVNLYLGNPQIVQQIQPVVLEQQAFDWLLENGKSSTKKVGFTEYMNP
ncbi:MAG: trigger factor [Woeseiaceae bacterium]|nr:trigger factor [Woeseiaceae bacterium]